ncbi:DinB family protein [Massilia sp. W12]|uniref:DinB family protein n=1 Tax=Massilia sp. W12 TaxID=3126507 RepID=UPI0030CB8718
MSKQAHLALMAEYNRWMNQNLAQAAAQLDAAALLQERGAFFSSIFGTLNHLVTADLIWLQRFSQLSAPASAVLDLSRFPYSKDLRAQPCADFAGWQNMRAELDALIVQWVAALREEDCEAALDYHTLDGQPLRKNMYSLCAHFFNHQTHHRGQASTLLFQAGVDIGVTDLNAIIPVV